MIRSRSVLTVALVSALLCGTSTACSSAGERGPGPLDGVWRSVGYGLVLAVSDGRVREFQTTSVSCLPSGEQEQVGAPQRDGTTGFGEDGEVERTLRPTDSGRAALRELGTAADIGLEALPELPGRCGRPVADDPVTTFDVALTTFAEHYNATTARGIDWAAVRERHRPRVDAGTSDGELFAVLRDVVRPLDDAHVELEAGDESYSGGLRPGTREEVDGATEAVDRHLRERLGVTRIERWADGAIAYADLPDGRGYLRFTSFDGWGTRPRGYAGRHELLERVLDAVFTAERVRSWRGLVLDVSNNGGGDDQLGVELAGRLTDTPYPAFTKRARLGTPDPTAYGPARTVTVDPTPGRPHYTGPLRVLTSDLSVSAAETVVEALVARTPTPRRVGTATQGVFSDTQSRVLPNGWTVGLGNESYTAPDGRDHEGRGVPPDVEVPMFTPDQLAGGGFPALDLPGDS